MDFSDYTYVMVSTLNQMVNYIPLKHFTFKEVVNITVEVPKDKDDKKIIKYFDNDKWDKNLTAVYKDKTPTDIKMDNQLFYSLTSIKNRLMQEIKTGVLNDKKIFWNITGGQRHILMAINQVADKEGDVICYLEGNNNQMMLFDVTTKETECVEYSLDLKKDLTVDIALQLMGLQFNSSNQEIGKEPERAFYKLFYTEYEKNKNLRERLIILNKNYPKIRDKKKNESDEEYKKHEEGYQRKKKEYQNLKATTKDEIKKILSALDQTMLDTKLNRNQAFGYILEELTFYKLEELLSKLIADKKVTLLHSLKVKDMTINNLTVAEFDIALLTNNGKFIMFECKSGVMEGDAAKARKYVTYAVSGVYGLPILINPLLSTETTESELVKNLDFDIYKYTNEAKGSAIRAGLEVWGIDEIATKLEKYINLTGATK
jgi:hypothetical protein